MKRFILLLNHDDRSLGAYLQHCLKKGEQFVKVSSNIFTFRKSAPSDDRITVVTYVNEDPDLKMKFQMEDYSALMKKRGWKVLDIGKPEDIFDSKRHVFLQTDKPDAPEPLIDPSLGEKARKRETKSLIRCLAMLLLMAGFAVFFLGHDPDIFLSSNHILFPCIAAFLLWAVSMILCVRGVFVISKKAQLKNEFRDYLVVDNAVLFCMVSAFALMAALVMDMFLFPDTGRIITKGEQRIKIYQDTLPLTMSDLSIPMDGVYHSARLTERSGILMQSLFGSEQSFSDPEGTTDLSLLSFSVYKSDFNFCLDWVASIKGLQKLPADEELMRQWDAAEVHSDGKHRLAVRYPNTLLVLTSSADLSDISPDIVREKLRLQNSEQQLPL